MLRRTLGLEKSTPSAILLQESNRSSIQVDMHTRFAKFEGKLMGMEEDRLVRRIWLAALRRKGSVWEVNRRKMYERVGWSCEWVEQLWEQGVSVGGRLKSMLAEVEMQERQNMLARSRYNPEYGRYQVHGVLPQYLGNRGISRLDKVTLARARCGSEEKGRKVWMGEEYGRCRLCGKGRDTWSHLARECAAVRNEWCQGVKSEAVWLDEKGKGINTIKRMMWEKESRSYGN